MDGFQFPVLQQVDDEDDEPKQPKNASDPVDPFEKRNYGIMRKVTKKKGTKVAAAKAEKLPKLVLTHEVIESWLTMDNEYRRIRKWPLLDDQDLMQYFLAFRGANVKELPCLLYSPDLGETAFKS
jgi:hypothetical protein